ncbi:DNA-binding response regulator [Algoriphagus lacus]|uniref:DNA-binding response regulator n=1 Tax=Algoriphagus lacus TaxID=2056311 RepID=A0A418PMS2_9BACT|nr:response regulator transcription factor [Algoriphagus lacus]RIW12546.1 DNA-binding response regulator [Algoriphagus lacus]
MAKIKLLLADDHPLIREGFKSLLGKNENFEIVAEAGNGMELLEEFEKTKPDIILTDISMPVLNGFEAMEQLIKQGVSVKFIVLTMHEEQGYILNALKIGAHGYVLKNIEGPDLEKAITTVYQGGKYFSPFITNIIAESFQRPEESDIEEITSREKEVLQLVAQGYSTKQIADKLSISIRTVESHRINMLRKLRVSNTAELIKKSIKLNLI